MRTLKQIIAAVTRDTPSARVFGGENTYASVEIPGSGGAHATICLSRAQDCGVAATYHDANDKGRRVTFKRGSEREDEVVVALANFLVLHEAVRDRRNEEKRRNRA